MLLRPPRSTRTDTLFPYTTLFRSDIAPIPHPLVSGHHPDVNVNVKHFDATARRPSTDTPVRRAGLSSRDGFSSRDSICGPRRSEERRVGKECVSTCRYRWSPYHSKKNHTDDSQNTYS